MPLNALPEELIREVLLQCLDVPLEQFFEFPIPDWAADIAPKKNRRGQRARQALVLFLSMDCDFTEFEMQNLGEEVRTKR